MAAEGHGAAGVVESPDPGALDKGSPETRDSPDHVHDPRPGEIYGAGAEERVDGFRGAEPPVGRPDPVRDDRVDEAGEEGGVDKVGDELGPLGDGAGGDARSRDREGPLIEEKGVVEAGRGRGDLVEAEEVAANEPVRGGAKGEGEAEEVVRDAPRRGIEHVGEHDVHRVLGAHGAGAEHRESELHGEDEVSGEEEVGAIDGEARVEKLVIYASEVGADVRQRLADEGHRSRRHVPSQHGGAAHVRHRFSFSLSLTLPLPFLSVSREEDEKVV